MGVLRLLLAMSVLCAHIHGKAVLGFRFLNGNLAVECFYMISGFYMALVLNQKYKPGQYGIFITQRYLRLWPTYFLIALLTLGVGALAWWKTGQPSGAMEVWADHGSQLGTIGTVALAANNLTLIGQDWVMFQAVDLQAGGLYWTKFFGHEPQPAYHFLVLGQSWTLGLELTFYLLAPWLVRQRYRVQAGILLASLIARCAGYFYGGLQGDPWDYRFFPFELAFFLAGSLAYQHYVRFPELMARWEPAMRKYWRWVFYAIVISYSRLPGHAEERYFLLVPLLFIVLPFLFYTTRDTRWDRLIGELSYPFYLGHELVIFTLASVVEGHLPDDTWGVVYVAATLLFSYGIFRYFESPLENWRHALVKGKVAAVGSSAPLLN